MNKSEAISFSGVSFSYGAAPVLDEVSFAVRAGEFVSMVGPNGGGKTTLLRLILGLEKPGSGTIGVLGVVPQRARPLVGYMPQQLRYDRSFPVTVEQVVRMGRMRHGRFWYSRRDRFAAAEALARVGLTVSAGRRFSELSGGQRQRVLIARALVSEPQLLLLDEPTSMVDAESQNQFVRTLRDVRGECTVVVVSHDMGFVSGLVDRVLFVNRHVRSESVGEVSGRSFEDLYGESLHIVGHSHGDEKDGKGRVI